MLKTKVNGSSVVCPQNHWDGCLWFGLKTGGGGFSRFGLKTGGSVFLLTLKTKVDGLSVVWPQNHWDCLLRFGFEIGGDGFSSVWVLKLMATVFEWFGLKTTQSVFTGLASNRW